MSKPKLNFVQKSGFFNFVFTIFLLGGENLPGREESWWLHRRAVAAGRLQGGRQVGRLPGPDPGPRRRHGKAQRPVSTSPTWPQSYAPFTKLVFTNL